VKLLKNIINWTVWSIIALYLLLLLITHLPICQVYIGKKVAQAIGDQLNTEVNVGRIDLGFLNRIIIDDVCIYDQQQKRMLQIARLSARVDILPLTEGKISISSAQLFGAHARLYKKSQQTKPNFQFVLDALASEDTTQSKPLDLRINSLIIRRSSIVYDQLDAERTEGIFNPQHLNVHNISAQIILKTLTNDSIDLNVKRLSIMEQSGLSIDKLSMHLKAGKNGAHLSHFLLQMPSTQLNLYNLEASYKFNHDTLDKTSLQYKGEVFDTYITPSDLRCFFNPLKNFQKVIHTELSFNGTCHQVSLPKLNLYADAGDVKLKSNGRVDLQDDKTSWNANIDELTVSENILDFIQKNIPKMPEQVKRIGNLQCNGTFQGSSKGDLSAHSTMNTDIGNLALDFTMTADKQYRGNIDTEGLNLKQLLDNEKLGLFATNLTFDGQLFEGRAPNVNAQGVIQQLDYNDYPFTNIGINGSYSSQGISGFLKVEDPNLALEIEGAFLKTSAGNDINLHGVVNHLVPQALKLSSKWQDAVFSANIDADFSAKTLNDAQGNLRISHFSMTQDSHVPYYLDNLQITSGYENNLHYLTLVSDFAKAELKGDFEYSTIMKSITNFIGTALPTLPGLPPYSDLAKNNFSLKLQVFKTDWLQRFLKTDLVIGQPVMLSARVNDYSRTIHLETQMPDITYNGNRYTNGDLHITTPTDTIECFLSFNKLMEDNHEMAIRLQAKAKDNLLNTKFNWDNHDVKTPFSGELNVATSLYYNLLNTAEAHVRVQRSHIILNGSEWNVEPSDVLYRNGDLLVDHFMVHNNQQHIIIDGNVSSNTNDSLTIDLNDMEVAYILNLVDFHAVEFSGEATGTVIIREPLDNFKANANLTVKDFKFENGRMGTLHALAHWNKEREQIDINAIADDGLEAKTIIRGYVSPTYNTIDLGIQANGTYLDFMHNFTNSFLSSITGHAQGAVRLAGNLDDINLTGQLVIDGESTVTPLNTTYTLKNDTVILVPNEIELRRMRLYDKNGNMGILSGGIHHESLTNLTYDLFVNANNLLAYDFKEFGESTFYGTVYASGDVDIHGRSGEVTINCNVTPEKNSVFVYNASSPDAITDQEFIQWGSGSLKDKSDYSQGIRNNHTSPLFEDIPTDIYINFLINCTPAATLRLLMDANTNDYITLNGDGAIRATFYNKGPFNMFGTFTVDHGTYGITIQNIIKKNFTFNRGGTIVFGGDPYNAALNLQALYTVNGVSLSDLNIGTSFASNTIRVNCLMNIGGQPNNPQVDFDLEMPTVNADEQQMVRSIINGQQEMNQQVLYLLGIGRFYNQGLNNANTEQADRTTLAMQSFLSGTLSTQINSLLNSVIKNDNWNFGANISTGDEGWHNAEYEGLVSGRMLNNRLLLNGQFGYRDNARQANPSFIGDFDIQYLLYPNGNLALKVYNQTNDRYFTKSSLNTQGIGLIMKKDFNGIRELFNVKKKKSKGK
jgi:hypothetical protein